MIPRGTTLFGLKSPLNVDNGDSRPHLLLSVQRSEVIFPCGDASGSHHPQLARPLATRYSPLHRFSLLLSPHYTTTYALASIHGDKISGL